VSARLIHPFASAAIAFRKQIQLAKHYKLPIVIHCRGLMKYSKEEEKSDDLFEFFIALGRMSRH
jgi:Tat protein secretion system quality control protein TatD with DNase activity